MATAPGGTHRPTLLGRDRLLAALDYEPTDDALLAQAFAHRSWCAEHAEYEQWELFRMRLYFGGARRALLRRKIIRVRRTA